MNTSKPLVFACFLLLSFFNVNAQNTYAPIGAEWYNDQPYGAYHSYVKGDTTIGTISCKIISQEAMYFPPGTSGYVNIVDPPQKTFYVYGTQDSVFIYNTIFNRFTPIFVFNVAAGDTVHLPIVPLQGCRGFNSIAADSMFHFVVDSVAVVSYSNIPLRTVYSHTIITAGAYYKWGAQNVYAELLGSLSSNILPNCSNCGQCLSVAHTITPGSLRCYHDSEHQINLTSETCNNGTTAVADISKTNPILDLYPNPTDDIIFIRNKTNHKIVNISLQTLTGKRFEIPVVNNQISLKDFPNGFYFVRIQMSNEYVVVKSVIVNH